jgi:transposase
MNVLHRLLNLHAAPAPPRLGAAGQQPRRQLEQTVRQRTVEVANRLTELGCGHAEAAQRLGVNERTLRSWRATFRQACSAALPTPLLGRPLAIAAPAQQQSVRAWLDEVGPGVGVPTLRRRFEGITRAELDELVKDCRRQWRAANMRALHVLKWQRPGVVWAADFATAPCLIDGRYPYLLAVRDLASGLQLLWQPVIALTADVLRNELALLFALHGVPWILKTDNGSAFIADVTRWFLQSASVHQLFSPPRCPSYNGSIEASIGALKRRTQLQSDHAGQPGLWTSDHLAAARDQANAAARPRRLHGQSPQQAWDARTPLTAEERNVFAATLAQCQTEARLERGLHPEQPLTRAQQAAVDRVAFSRALVAHDLLLFRRRRIPPKITRPKLAIQA